MSSQNYAAPVVSREPERYHFMSTSLTDEYAASKKVPKEFQTNSPEKDHKYAGQHDQDKTAVSPGALGNSSKQTQEAAQLAAARQVGLNRLNPEYDYGLRDQYAQPKEESALHSPEKFAKYRGVYSTSNSYGYQITPPSYGNIEPSDKSQLSFRVKPSISYQEITPKKEASPEKVNQPSEISVSDVKEQKQAEPEEKYRLSTTVTDADRSGGVYGPYRYAPTEDQIAASPTYELGVSPKVDHRSPSPSSILNKFSSSSPGEMKSEYARPPVIQTLPPPKQEQEIFLSKDSYVSLSDSKGQAGTTHVLGNSDPFPFQLEFKPISDSAGVQQSSPESEAGYFSFSPNKRSLDQLNPRQVGSLLSQPSAQTSFEQFYDVPRLLLAIEVERLALVQQESTQQQEVLREAAEALDFKEDEIRRLQRLLDDERVNHKRTVEELIGQTNEKNKSIEALSEGIKSLQFRVKEIERTRSHSPVPPQVPNEEDQKQLVSKIVSSISGTMIPFFEQFRSHCHKGSDEKSVRMCSDAIRQFEQLQTVPLTIWKNESKRAVTTMGISLDSLARSLEENRIAKQNLETRGNSDSRSPSYLKANPQSLRDDNPRGGSMDKSVLIEEKIEMIDGRPTKVRYIKRETSGSRDNSVNLRTPEKADSNQMKNSSHRSPESNNMSLALTQRLIEENCRIAEEFNKVKMQNKVLKEKVQDLEFKYTSDAGSNVTTAPGSAVGSTKRFEPMPQTYGTRTDPQTVSPPKSYHWPPRTHEDLY